MKFSVSEKIEIIRLVENSNLGITRTLRELKVNRSSFYNWYYKFQEYGMDGLTGKQKSPDRIWNRIPELEKEKVLQIANQFPEKSCREVACYTTDHEGYFISESSVYRILKQYGLIQSPAYCMISAKDKFENPTSRINELWQTDFTYFKIVHWGWYYLSTILDDYSRFIISWKLCKTMGAEDVKNTLEDAIEISGIQNVNVQNKPRLLSDNGPCYISSQLADYLKTKSILQIHGRPYHPMTQGKIERYHRSMKNLILLDNYYSPSELENQIALWVDYYNNHRYHEAINNVTPADRYFSRESEIISQRKRIKNETMEKRRKVNQNYFQDLKKTA